jgi:hypothetical protein
MRNFEFVNIFGEKWKVEYHDKLIDKDEGGKASGQVEYDKKIIRIYKKQYAIDLLECFIHEFLHIIVEKKELYKIETLVKEFGKDYDGAHEYGKYKEKHRLKGFISEFRYKKFRKLWTSSIGNQFLNNILIEHRVDSAAKHLSKILYDNGFINPEYR